MIYLADEDDGGAGVSGGEQELHEVVVTRDQHPVFVAGPFQDYLVVGAGQPASFVAPPSFSNPDQVAAASAGLSPFGPPQPGVVPEDILFLARSGKKIQAIAEYRRRAGVSLKAAKDIIDQASRGD